MTSSTAAGLEVIVRLSVFCSVILATTRMLKRSRPIQVATVQEIALLGLLVLPIFTICGLSLPLRVLPAHREKSNGSGESPLGALPARDSRIDDLRMRLPEPVEHKPTGPTPAVTRSPRAVPKPVALVASSLRGTIGLTPIARNVSISRPLIFGKRSRHGGSCRRSTVRDVLSSWGGLRRASVDCGSYSTGHHS